MLSRRRSDRPSFPRPRSSGALAQEHADDRAFGCAERDADGDLLVPLLHGVGGDAVDAEHREKGRDRGKPGQQERQEPGACKRLIVVGDQAGAG